MGAYDSCLYMLAAKKNLNKKKINSLVIQVELELSPQSMASKLTESECDKFNNTRVLGIVSTPLFFFISFHLTFNEKSALTFMWQPTFFFLVETRNKACRINKSKSIKLSKETN